MGVHQALVGSMGNDPIIKQLICGTVLAAAWTVAAPFAARWSTMVKPGCQRPAGFQYMAFSDRTGALGVVIGDCLDQFVVLIEGVLFVFGEEG